MFDEAYARIQKQLHFIREIDQVKQVVRQTLLLDKSRQENDAEHSWHMAMAIFILLEHANNPQLNIVKAIQMALIHDVVEIDAGDTYAYDEDAHANKYDKELKAANRIFGLLPDDQAEEYKALWIEFEEGKTDEAQFVGAVDRFMPIYHNYRTDGEQWISHGVSAEMVLNRNKPAQKGSQVLWDQILGFIDDCKANGIFK